MCALSEYFVTECWLFLPKLICILPRNRIIAAEWCCFTLLEAKSNKFFLLQEIAILSVWEVLFICGTKCRRFDIERIDDDNTLENCL